MVKRLGAWLAVVGCVAFSTPGMAGQFATQKTPRFEDYFKQSGLIEEPSDKDGGMPAKTAEASLEALRAGTGRYKVDSTFAAKHLLQYYAIDPPQPHVHYMAFVEGSEFYPSVVKRHVILGQGHMEVHSTVQCGATALACYKLRYVLDHIDRQCGREVQGCPGYQPAAGLPGPVGKMPAVPWPPPPPPPPPLPSAERAGNAPPVYPLESMYAGEEGTTVILVLVGTDGRPLEVKVDRSSSAHPLDRAAVTAASHWVFPHDGTSFSLPRWFKIPVVFRLSAHAHPDFWGSKGASVRYVAATRPMPYRHVEDAYHAAGKKYPGAEDGERIHFPYLDSPGPHAELWYFYHPNGRDAVAIHLMRDPHASTPTVRVSALCEAGPARCAKLMPVLLKGPWFLR